MGVLGVTVEKLVIVVSIHKSGTNLVSQLMKNLGYKNYGMGIDGLVPEDPQTFPEFLSSLPPMSCYFLHYLPIQFEQPMKWQYPNLADTLPIVRLWTERYSPPLIFNYRDPRAVLSSFVHYYLSLPKSEKPYSPLRQIHKDILEALPDHTSRLKYMMNAYPTYLHRSFRENAWLMFHPKVTRVPFECLVGREGGGTERSQFDVIEQVAKRVGFEGNCSQLISSLFGGTRTFRTGQIDSWKKDYSAQLLEEFERTFGDILTAYGYQFFSQRSKRSKAA